MTDPNATAGVFRGEDSGDESLASTGDAGDFERTDEAASACEGVRGVAEVASSSALSESPLRDDDFDTVEVMDRLLRYEVVVEMLSDRRTETGDEPLPLTGDDGGDLAAYGSGCGAQHSPE